VKRIHVDAFVFLLDLEVVGVRFGFVFSSVLGR
jgi:hypothetical protein